MRLKLDQESHWDVRQSLCGMAKELYNESVQVLDADGLILFDAASIARRREAIEAEWKNDPLLKELKDLLQRCDPEKYNRYTATAYDRLKRSVADPESVPTRDRFRGVSEKSCNADEMAKATELAARVGRRYNTLQLTIRFSRDQELMASLQALIQRNLSEANCALLARTAGTLSKALREGDADFILEKAGIRYKHVLMDEFQDTSQLQWSVIRKLLEDVLAGAGHTLLIVGDIKQSIYRWRNGDWHIMDGLTNEGVNELTNERINERFTSLTKNFRSSEEVVKFNLSLFDYIIRKEGASERIYGEDYKEGELAKFYQSDKKRGGFVRFKAFPKGTKEELAQDMFEQIGQLLDKGAHLSDILILVREKKEANLICDLSPYPIVSADSYVLEASADVQLVMAGMKVLVNDDVVAAKLIEMRTGSADFINKIKCSVISGQCSVVSGQCSVFETVNALIRILLTDEKGQYHGTETAYLNNLLDRTRAYVGSYGSNLSDFLTYWEDTMRTKAIPAASSDAIRILTVHASKGLQAQTVFVPFCMWPKEAGRHPQKVWCPVAPEIGMGEDYVPIQDGLEMADSAYHEAYEEEHANMRIDNLNMLYVALTRAEDNLFISTSYPVTVNGAMGTCNHVGRYIMDFVGEDEFITGETVIKAKSEERRAKSQELRAELWSDSGQVRFVQSQEGALYTDYGDEAYRRVARMDEGTLCHEIFAHLRKADELDAVLDTFESNGQIKDKAQRESLRELISSAWNGNNQMRDWFTAPWELRLEEAIYIDHRELRPDRVMINPQTNEAIVLDYKFGGWDKKYYTQVNEYKEALRRIGYNPVRGYLWFARKNKLEEVK